MLTPNTLIHQRYRISQPIGQGGMGAVDQAIDERLGNTVALKQCLSSDAQTAQAFAQEARTLAGRWVVEGTFAWLTRCRRLSVDYEGLPERSEAWIYLAMIRLMMRRLAHE